jgi:hypothetical protein
LYYKDILCKYVSVDGHLERIVEIGGKKYIYDGHILHEMSGER